MKKCTKCGEFKKLTEFYKHSKCKDGILSYCKECDRKRHKKYAEENKDVLKIKKRKYLLKTRYGIDEEFYEYMLISQDRKCAICGNTLGTNDGHRLAVDHCHETGKVRGLLCKVCNNAIGLFREKEEYFLNAIEYLRIHRRKYGLSK